MTEYPALHLPVIVILLPLCSAAACPLLSRFSPSAAKKTVIAALMLSCASAVWQLMIIIDTGSPITYVMGGWAAPYGVELVIDGINGLILVLITCIASLTAVFSSPFEEAETGSFRSTGYYTILCVLAVGLIGLTASADVFSIYVFMELVAVSGYGLIAIGEEKGPIAAFRYLLTGTIGSSMYLLGVGFLYAATGTLGMSDLAARLQTAQNMALPALACACLMVGFGIKMALFPFHTWQPAAHSYAHPAADPMIAGVMIKIPAYAMFRFFYFVFPPDFPAREMIFSILGILGMCGILFGSLKALKYDKYNKILAYSSIGQVGYIALGFAIGNFYGVAGAIFHIVSHAFMKAGLFYTSAALKYKYGIHYIDEFGQVYRTMPVTALTMVTLSLSMVGLPPFAGFFSKWYLALGAFQAGRYLYIAVLIISSLLGAVYFFRIFERMFMGEDKCLHDNCPGREAPLRMLIPMCIAAAAIIALGLGNTFIIDKVLKISVMGVL